MFVVGGESLVDLVASPRGADGIIKMSAHQGGSPYNCAIALAKLDQASGFLCPISRDGFGDYLMEPLDAAGVEVLLAERVFAPTTLAVVTLNERAEAQYEFYRGADRALDRDRLVGGLPRGIDAYQIGGFCPIEAEDAGIWLDVARAAGSRGAVLSMDPNLRPALIADMPAYLERLGRFLDLVHMVKLSEEDLELLDAGKSIDAHAAALLARRNCRLVVVTGGDRGSRAYTQAGRAEAGVHAPEVLGDTVGAGDSLMAGILCWLRENGRLSEEGLASLGAKDLGEMLQFGAVVAGINCGRHGCNPPTRAEVDEVLGGRSADGQRRPPGL